MRGCVGACVHARARVCTSHTSDLKIGIIVASRSGAWRHRVSVRTGRADVSIMWVG